MASTNKTINYDLSQYVANDKPTYLVDYNSDMNKIDTQMKANSDLAGLAKTEADDLSSRVDGQDVIIGNLNTTIGQHTTDISTLNTNVSAVNTKVGDLTNLNTTDKTDIVSAVNEVNTKVGDLTNLNTTDKTNTISAINEVNGKVLALEESSIYKTTEHVVGQWIDGRPVYRKTIIVNQQVALQNGSNSIAHGISNIGDYIDIKNYGFYYNNELYTGYENATFSITAYRVDSTNININVEGWGGLFKTGYIIIEYTKSI